VKRSSSKHTECIVAFLLQQWLRVRAMMLRYRYNVYLSVFKNHRPDRMRFPWHPSILANKFQLWPPSQKQLLLFKSFNSWTTTVLTLLHHVVNIWWIRYMNCQLSTEYLRSLLFWDVTQRRLVFSCLLFGTTYSFFFDSLLLKVGPIDCPETSVTEYQSMLSNIPDERGSHLYHGGSLTSSTCTWR
jgi:hypothetical protein